MTGGKKIIYVTKVILFHRFQKPFNYCIRSSYLLISVIYLSDPVAPLKALAIHTAGNTAAYLSNTCGKHNKCLKP